jgi:ribosomal protein L3
MTTMVKKKTIKENAEHEESEYRRKVGSISKQEMNTPKNTVWSQRRS